MYAFTCGFAINRLLLNFYNLVIFLFPAEEKKLVDEVFQNAMMVLSEEDRALPQVENVLPLLKVSVKKKIIVILLPFLKD